MRANDDRPLPLLPITTRDGWTDMDLQVVSGCEERGTRDVVNSNQHLQSVDAHVSGVISSVSVRLDSQPVVIQRCEDWITT
jgi:hypothetical protein